ncbi:poly(3-hydroxybutyrate) depolymerase [Devosia limi DSM 17137]|uniref:Phage portal protein, HK97 family n=1 Tax=Devosia limi DSM 17137 TaxID=1121477 RepID=A0A0F5LVV2_9HYPH|nr:phage portal protein [Devosia limi]KKB86463.1 poly(3-hydroxybutyrate) depolymerase [Devosia limi DSM 17137]SHE88053.1 phage portal protein, HK97 family [Devosia limi DSM 17137]
MRLPFGLNITREKAAGNLTRPDTRGGWWPRVMEPFTGAWQKNIEVNLDSVLANHAVFACQTLIASDISKLRIKLVQQDEQGIWTETKSPAYSPVLRKPNHFQNRIQFMENWVLSKLSRGNTYVLKQRDGRGVVVKFYILDPALTQPLVADSGEVFYELNTDKLAGLPDRVIVPAREIIHDRFNCFFHPLVGLSPIFAGGLAAAQGLAIQNNSATFFKNGSLPGGILTAAGAIDDDTAAEMKTAWEQMFSGANRGKVAVLGDGLKFEPVAAKAVDSQMIEQLKWSAEVVCSTYHVPPYKIGIGAQPTYNNVQALNTEYYSQCLQVLFEAIELCLDEGLETGDALGTEFDIDNLLRMDSASQMDVLEKARSVMTLNERRRRLDLKGVPGGETIYMQQQDHSIEAIAARDAQLIATADAAPAEPAQLLLAPPVPEKVEDKQIDPRQIKRLFATRKAA